MQKNNNILQCDHCKTFVDGVEHVFITTPDTFENRINGNFDEGWCRDCIVADGRKTIGQKLQELNEKRKNETK